MSGSSSQFIVLFKSYSSFLIFYNWKNGIEIASIPFKLYISPFSFVIFCFMYFGTLLGTYVFKIYIFLLDLYFCHCKMSLFDSCNNFSLKVYFTCQWYSCSSFYSYYLNTISVCILLLSICIFTFFSWVVSKLLSDSCILN